VKLTCVRQRAANAAARLDDRGLGCMRSDKWFDHNYLVNLIPMSSGQLFVCKHEAKFAQQTAGSIVPVLQDGEAG
jgi:hypothetical protein